MDATYGGATGETVESLRPLLFSIAYRMLARVSDAEDLVQEAIVRYLRAEADGVVIESPKAYLTTVVTRLAIDDGRSARSRRETYVGEWLPEPLLTDGRGYGADDPALLAEQADSLSMAFLLLLERLNPVERAVYLLHDIFDYGYEDIAGIVGKTPANCRQLALRARKHLEQNRPRFDVSGADRDRLAARFFAATTDGDVDRLASMLAAEAVVYGDGGGKAPQWMRPVVGVDHVARLFAGLGPRLAAVGGTIRPQEVNGQAGAVVLDPDGLLINVFALDIVDGRIHAVRSVINPDKLAHLGPLADPYELLRRSR